MLQIYYTKLNNLLNMIFNMFSNKYPSAHVAPTFLNETEKTKASKLYYTTIAEHQSSSTKQIFKFLEFEKK